MFNTKQSQYVIRNCNTVVQNMNYRRSIKCRSQWPRGPDLRAAAIVLLGLRVRIPPGEGCLSCVNVVCRQVEVYATDRSLVQRSHTDFGVTVCDLDTSTMGWSRHELDCCDKEIK
jgi:hypothetical protein